MPEDSEQLIILGNNIRKARNRLNMSQQGLADLSNVGKRTIQRIEGGEMNPSVLVLLRICKEVGITPEEALGFI